MCDDEIQLSQVTGQAPTRRTVVAGVGAASAMSATAAMAAGQVAERDVEVRTPEGVADAYLLHPAGKGPWPAVLIWPDIMGLRPVFRDMGRRLAAEGYVVLVVNAFYRSFRGPVTDRAQAMSLRAAFTPAGTASDAKAFVAFLDAQPQTDKKKLVGVQGYCMGGPLTIRTAAAVPARVGAAASFHGAAMVTDQPDSPHLLIREMKGDQALICISEDDDGRQPDAKTVLKAAFDREKVLAKVEVYPTKHGWCVPGNAVYDEAQAEKAWAELLALYRRALV